MTTEATPKQQYEARRAKVREERAKREFYNTTSEDREEMTFLLMERFATAAERIADALEARGA